MWNIGRRCNPKDYEGLSNRQYGFIFALLVFVAVAGWWCAYYCICVPMGASPDFWPCLWSGIKFYFIVACVLAWLVGGKN